MKKIVLLFFRLGIVVLIVFLITEITRHLNYQISSWINTIVMLAGLYALIAIISDFFILAVARFSKRSPSKYLRPLIAGAITISLGLLGMFYYNRFLERAWKTQDTYNQLVSRTMSKVMEEQRRIDENNMMFYTISSGDTLWDIAIKYYGSGFEYYRLVIKNNIIDPNLIFIGQDLTVPALQK